MEPLRYLATARRLKGSISYTGVDKQMISFSDARSVVFEAARPVSETEVTLENALGFVLARDVTAPIDLPSFSNSSMDGFAIASADTDSIANLAISQTIKAGDNPPPLERGTCAKIMTGAPVPDGADTIVPIEHVVANGNTVTFKQPIIKGQYVRCAGEDVHREEVAARRGTIVTSRHVAFFAAMGIRAISVFEKPRVTIILTGSELTAPGDPLKRGEIYDSNGIALRASLLDMGISSRSITVNDDEDATSRAIGEALLSSDIILTVGGISVGDFDHVKQSFRKNDIELKFWRVAMKPGKPFAFGTAGRKLIFGLPGNPVSCLITFEQFVMPAILKMMGRGNITKQRYTAAAAETLTGSRGITDFLRGICKKKDDRLVVKSSGRQGSAMLKSFSDANCLIIIPEDKDSIEEGEFVEIEVYE